MSLRILYVDEDIDALERFSVDTARSRPDWVVAQARGADEAARSLTTNAPPDVVVVAQDLEGSAGSVLLKETLELTSNAIRLVCSTRSSIVPLANSLPWLHGALSVHGDGENWCPVIEALVADPDDRPAAILGDVVAKITSIPVLPRTYQRMSELVLSEHFDLDDVAKIIGEDIALATETIRLVNSSYFALRSDITSLAHAVRLLGLDVVRGLVLAKTLFVADEHSMAWLDFGAAAEHAQSVAAVARTIAKIDGHPARDQSYSFLAGIVHNVGLLMMAQSDATIPVGSVSISRCDLDRDTEFVGAHRYSLAAYLLHEWGIEPEVVEAVAALSLDEPQRVSPAARSIRHARDLIAAGGISVSGFVSGDDSDRALVAARRRSFEH